MSDPFSAAAGVISVVGFAGQVTQGIHYLHRVLNDIKHAPESIKKIQSNLKLLESILLEVNEVTVPTDKELFVRDAHQQCKDEVAALEALVKKYEPSIGDGRVKKKMKGIRAGLLAAEFEKRSVGIERAKATLEIVLAISHLHITRDLHMIQKSDTQKLNDKLDDLTTSVRSFSGCTFISSTSVQVSGGIFNAGIDDSERKDYCNPLPDQHASPNTAVNVQAMDDKEEEEEIFEEALEYLGLELERSDISKTFTCSDRPSENPSCANQLDNHSTALISDRYEVTRSNGEIRLGLASVQWSTTRSSERSRNHESGRCSSRSTYTFFPSPTLHAGGVQVVWHWNSVYGRISSPWASLRLINRIPKDAPIIKAVRCWHLSKVIELISSGQASAYDVDESGKNLVEHAIFPGTGSLQAASIDNGVLVLVKYLIDCGAEGGRAMHAVYLQQRALRLQQGLIPSKEGGDLTSSGRSSLEVRKSWQALEDVSRICLDKAIEDPYQDTQLRLGLWSSSEVGLVSTPIDSFYLYHENWSIDIQGLALEQPGAVFHLLLIVEVLNPTSHHELVTRLNRRYAILASLYDAGIPQKAFKLKDGKTQPEKGDGYCGKAERHLIHALFAKANLLRCAPKYRDTVRQHIKRTLILLLKNGEDPHLRCPCAVLWNGNEGELRTPTDLAIGRALLNTWKEALLEAGFSFDDFAEDRVVSLPIENCLGVWTPTTSLGTKKKFNLSPELQRKFLKKLSYLA